MTTCRLVFAAPMLLVAVSCGDPAAKTPFRLGYQPHVTHAPALVAQAMSRRGDGIFEKHFGKTVAMEWLLFGTGVSAMDALRSGALDATFVGPSPVLDAYARGGDDGVRVLAGATSGGAALVVRKGAGISGPADFRGRRVATPRAGNTQDVRCRAWLVDHGYSLATSAPDVTVVAIASSEQVDLFRRGELDATWTVEPWVSSLERDGSGTVLVADDSVTTVLVASATFVRDHPDVIGQLVAAHRELTAWIHDQPAEAKSLVAAQLQQVTGTAIEPGLIDHCWPRLRFTAAVRVDDFQMFVDSSRRAGLTDVVPDLSRLMFER